MSSRTGFALAVGLLLIAVFFRFWSLATLPAGLSDAEIVDIRIAEAVRAGRIEVFYNLSPLGAEGGREGLYHILLAVITAFTGNGLIGYRMLSVFASLLTLALIYAVGMRLYGPLAGVLAMALTAVSMLPVVLGRNVGRETFLPLLVAGTLLVLIKALPVYQRSDRHAPSTATYGGMGLLLGLSFYIHPASFMITLFAMLFIGYMVISPAPLSRRTISYSSFAILLLIIIIIPYLLSSIRLPALDGAGRVFGGYTIDQLSPIQALWNGFRGLFFVGDTNPTYNLPGRPLFDLVSGVFILIGSLTALRSWTRPRYMLLLMALVILSPIAFLNVNSPNFARSSVILPMLALLFGLGVVTLRRSLAPGTRWVLSLGVIVLLGFNLFWVSRDLFQTWPALPDMQTAYHSRIGQLAHHVDLTAEKIPTVICARSVFPSQPRRELSDSQLLLLMMNRERPTIRFADCGTGLIFTNGGSEEQVIFTNPNTLPNIHPYLREWLEQGLVVDRPGIPPDSVVMLDVSSALADKLGLFTTTVTLDYAPETNGSEGPINPPVRYGGNLTLLGYEPNPDTTYVPGSIVTVITYWRVEGPPPPDMRLFTHILSDPANIIAQTDTRSVLPGQLQERDIFIQITFVSLPLSTPPGDYAVSVGVYQDSDRMRMNVLDDDRPRGTRLFLNNHPIVVHQPASE
ncbi:MAG: glycosyltransferase family 39 protein [Anaerolineae bacterium]|nr:glycosyltransferase family 39 protein [Anaerolineae bacterium]